MGPFGPFSYPESSPCIEIWATEQCVASTFLLSELAYFRQDFAEDKVSDYAVVKILFGLLLITVLLCAGSPVVAFVEGFCLQPPLNGLQRVSECLSGIDA